MSLEVARATRKVRENMNKLADKQEAFEIHNEAQAPINVTLALSVETEAAKALIANMRDTMGDDAELVADMVEGETGFFEALQRAVERIGEIEAHAKGLAEYGKSIAARKSRFDIQAETLRTAVSVAMETVGVKSREMPMATVSLREKDQEVVITDEALIPSEFWKPQDPTLDRAALRKAAKAGQDIPGTSLDNGGNILTIRRS